MTNYSPTRHQQQQDINSNKNSKINCFYKTKMASNNEIRIVLVGKTGAGKTTTMYKLLGKENPEAGFKSASSRTTECKIETVEKDGYRLVVVDTPGVDNTKLTEAAVKKEIVKCMTYAAPGPHVILYVLKAKHFTTEDCTAIEIIQKMFGGKESKNYTMALFTRGDDPEISIMEDKHMKAFCDQYYSFVSNGDVSELLNKIKDMVKENQFYTNDMFKKAQEVLEQEIKKKEVKGMTPKIATDDLARAVDVLLALTIGEPWKSVVDDVVNIVSKKVEQCATQ
ncbi:GTPase IMAP family member 4 isoform X2 [Dicentrarchus labrax]|nr:GTPase IMAP family member 4 isoform X1 [Dicentrarchus labrax]XP_051250047.1 GTPase IMAP family member 4 isoform X2 [Dicentrarchus labrax]